MSPLEIKARVQTIYYQTDDNNLGQEYTTSDKKVSIVEAEEVLRERDIEFDEVLKVKYEIHVIYLQPELFEHYLKPVDTGL